MLSNSQWRQIQSLKLKKFRQKYGEFLIEGDKIVLEALNANFPLHYIIATADWLQANKYAIPSSVQVTEALLHQIEKISLFTTPQQVIGVAEIPNQPKMQYANDKWILALDGINDPGNLGAIIRSADWFGVETIICSETCADCYNPKAVQASMGSIFRISIIYDSLTDIITQLQLPVYAAHLHGTTMDKIQNTQSGILVIGSESHGVSKELLAMSNYQITIPKKGKAESLNAAVACAILLSALT